VFDANTNWIIAFCLGAVLIGFHFFSQFDESSYDKQTDFFGKYKPRFTTSKMRYVRAKIGYVLTFLTAYGIFAFVPEIFFTLLRDTTQGPPQTIQSPTVVPIVVAIALATLHKNIITKDTETRIRAFYHSLAQIPECIRRTVAQLRNSEFTFDEDGKALQTSKLNIVDDVAATIDSLLRSDEVTRLWYRVGCSLYSLEENKRANLGY
jgi:hypothetical protein